MSSWEWGFFVCHRLAMTSVIRITFSDMSEEVREVEVRAREYWEAKRKLDKALSVALKGKAPSSVLSKAAGVSRTTVFNWVAAYDAEVEGRGVEVDVVEALNDALTVMTKLVEPEVAEDLLERVKDPSLGAKLVGMRVNTKPVKLLTEPERKAVRRGRQVLAAVNRHRREHDEWPITVTLKP